MRKDYIENIEGGERRMVSQAVEFRKDGDAEYFEGMAVPFGQVTDLGYFSEEISRDAFSDVLKDDVRGLFNHDPDVILGRSTSGTMGLKLTDKGVFYSIRYNPNDPDHVRVMEKVKRGDVSQSSYAFTVKDETWGKREGKSHRVIEKIQRWYDVSPVTYPANPNTTVAKRSLDAIEKKTNDEQKEQNERTAKYRQIQHELVKIKLGIF
jgi:HK97 family phage prohead protease